MVKNELAMLYQTARWGFNTVPVGIEHPVYGASLLTMSGSGISIESLDGKFSQYSTWVDFDERE